MRVLSRITLCHSCFPENKWEYTIGRCPDTHCGLCGVKLTTDTGWHFTEVNVHPREVNKRNESTLLIEENIFGKP